LSHAVNDGPLLVAAAVAALVGVVGFLSPCVLPLVPGYLSYVAGLSGEQGNRSRPSQGRMVTGAVLFVVGFSAIFILGGVLFGSVGAAVRDHTNEIARWLGVVTILMGVVFLGGFGLLQREFKVHRLPVSGLLGAHTVEAPKRPLQTPQREWLRGPLRLPRWQSLPRPSRRGCFTWR